MHRGAYIASSNGCAAVCGLRTAITGVTPLSSAHNVASSAGTHAAAGQGTGTAHQAIRNN